MNKTQLIDKMSEKTKQSKKDTAIMVEAFTKVVEEELCKGSKVQLTGFGTFEPKKRAATQGRNPRKPEQVIKIPAKTVPAFKAGKNFKEKINK